MKPYQTAPTEQSDLGLYCLQYRLTTSCDSWETVKMRIVGFLMSEYLKYLHKRFIYGRTNESLKCGYISTTGSC